MGHLTLDHYAELDTVVFTGKGILAGRQVVDANRWREANCPTGRTLWDLRMADMSEIALAELKQIVEELARQVPSGGARRTALIMGDDVSQPIGRLYAQIAEHRQLPIESRLFETMDEACGFLGIGNPERYSPKVQLSF